MATATKGPSAKPGNKAPEAAKPPKEKKVRTKFVVPEGGLKEWPTDHDPKVHKPLKSTDFADESVYWFHKADQLEKAAVAAREKAEQIKKLGGVKDVKKAKRLMQMQQKIAELKAQLASDGTDVDALLASLGGDEESADE